MPQPSLLANRYQLDRKVAQGGMGVVWDARDLQLERRVAIKIMHDMFASEPEARMRFFHEARLAASIQSPHVAHVIDFGIAPPTLFIVMEWLEGEDLGRRLKRQGHLPPGEIFGILWQLARGLKKAHAQGVIHRDLKPANVFISEIDGEPVVKILDFGIATRRDATTSGEREVLGSLPFISPEQARGAHVDHRSDLWSVGVLVFLALTGRLPFDRLSTEMSPNAPSSGRALDLFFARAFEAEPSARFQSIDELAEAFYEAAGRPTPTLALPSQAGPLLASVARLAAAAGERR